MKLMERVQKLEPPYTMWSIFEDMVGDNFDYITGAIAVSNGSGAVWPSANLAIYIPFRLFVPTVITHLWRMNGATLGTDHFDIGLFTLDGTKVVSSGSTLTAGSTNLPQVINTTDTLIGPGYYYLGMSQDGTTDTVLRLTTTAAWATRAIGILEQATAFTLPAAATFAAATNTYIPSMGLVARAVTV